MKTPDMKTYKAQHVNYSAVALNLFFYHLEDSGIACEQRDNYVIFTTERIEDTSDGFYAYYPVLPDSVRFNRETYECNLLGQTIYIGRVENE